MASDEHYTHSAGEHEDPEASMTWLIGGIGVLMLVVIIAGVTALLKSMEQVGFDDVYVNRPTQQLETYLEEQDRLLSDSPRLVEYRHKETDEIRTRVVIPVDRAMELIVEEYASQRSADAGNAEQSP